jgi:hypothetical protein
MINDYYYIYDMYYNIHMANINPQPKWEERHTKIVDEYEKRKKEGNINEFVIVPLDNN